MRNGIPENPVTCRAAYRQDAEEPFHELPESPARAVLCMLLSMMLLACEEGARAPPVPPGRVKSSSSNWNPGGKSIRRPSPGRIASFQVAEVRPQVGGILQQRLFTEART